MTPRCPNCVFNDAGYLIEQCPEAQRLWKRKRENSPYFHHVFGDQHPRGLRWNPAGVAK